MNPPTIFYHIMFQTTVRTLFQALSADPAILKRSLPAMVTFLHSQGRADAQGTGNKPTDQEASFADTVTTRGFHFLAKGAPPPAADGLYYLYQLQGSQKEGDFGLREYEGGAVKAEVIVDLKHTLSKSFYLNDGWFQKDVVYIVSWNAGTPKKPALRTHVALGQDIPSAEEQAFMTELQAFKREKNSGTTKVGSLRPYIRFANQYSCERFTPETAATHLQTTLAWV
jgi:hypothetical protein